MPKYDHSPQQSANSILRIAKMIFYYTTIRLLFEMGAVVSYEKKIDILAIGGGVLFLHFLDLLDANQLRRLNRHIKRLVSDFPWKDRTRVKNLPLWRQVYPKATTCILDPRVPLTDATARYLQGCIVVRVPCNFLSEAAFVYLKGVRELTLDLTDRSTFDADTAFKHLAGVHTLIIHGVLAQPGCVSVQFTATFKGTNL